jgi:hypothetical protein
MGDGARDQDESENPRKHSLHGGLLLSPLLSSPHLPLKTIHVRVIENPIYNQLEKTNVTHMRNNQFPRNGSRSGITHQRGRLRTGRAIGGEGLPIPSPPCHRHDWYEH